jgi:radical SAM superfamily enzyme YgiQ (UPF0313 family)
MNTNVLFIVMSYALKKDSTKNVKQLNARVIPYGVLSIATYLKRNCSHDINIKIIDCNLYEYNDYIILIKNTIKDFNPDIIGLSMNFDNSYKYLDSMRFIKDNNNNDNNNNNDKVPIVILGGGAVCSLYKKIVDEYNYIDAICYTEGEIPLLQLVNCKNKGIDRKWLIENHISFITKKSLEQNKIPESSFVKNLDDVVDIDYSLIDIENYRMIQAFPFLPSDKYKEKKKNHFYLITSRGCPYRCVFCGSHTLYNNQIRYASVDKVISHVKYLVENYGMNLLSIYDEQLLINKKRAKELFRELAQFNLRIDTPNGLSIAFIDDEMIYLMKKAGFDTAVLAVESGSDYMLKKVIHKPYDIKMVKPLVQTLRKYDFFILAAFVVGIPGETEKYRQETIDFIRDIEFDWITINPATPLRGSELYDICIKNGYIEKNPKIGELEYEMKNYIINAPPHLSPSIINRAVQLMNLDINFVNNYRIKVKDYKTAEICFKDVIDRVPDHAFAYYYLAKAQFHMNKIPESDANKKKFNEIILKDNIWKEYADHFNLVRSPPPSGGGLPTELISL